MKRNIVSFIVILAVSTSVLFAQTDTEPLRMRYGVFGDFNFNIHTSNFPKLPNVDNCCKNFSGGIGTGPSLGGLFEMPFSEEFLFSIRAGWYSIGALLRETEATEVLLPSDELVDGEFEHRLDAGFSTISLEPMIGSQLFDNFFLYAGVNLGFLIQSDYSQKEQITKPTDYGVFNDSTKKRVRNDSSGTIEQAAGFLTSLKVGASYELPLNRDRTLLAAPEVSFTYGLTNIVNGLIWKVSTLSIGVAIKYSPKETIPVKEELRKRYEIDTITIKSPDIAENSFRQGNSVFKEKKTERIQNLIITNEIYKRTDTLYVIDRTALSTKLTTYAVYENNRREKAISFHLSQQYVTQGFSLLPFVFFDKNSAEIPARYRNLKTKDGFDIDSLEVNPVVYHQNVLNIIGRRMLENKNTGIVITGFADAASENGDCELAKKRANEVRNYLMEFWGIKPDRILITRSDKNCVPEIFTRTQNEFGYADNRQVMITTEDNELLQPIIKNRYIEITDMPVRALEHEVISNPKENVSSWSLDEYQVQDESLYNKEGNGNPDILRQDITEGFANSLVGGKNLVVNTVIKDKYGSNSYSEFSIPVQKDTSEFEVQRLTLAIFKVSGDILRDIDKKAIQNFIKNLRPGDSISVTGYTDQLGGDAYNMNLSSNRARNVCDYIRQLTDYKKHSAEITQCLGVGFTKKPPQIYSYELPEERFLSRIVQIEIRRRWR
ncbi:MAG: OmpA family protein [Ignavibacteriae bacterium]|nr:OmpA family protein [Ignavibacteriota bacterium]